MELSPGLYHLFVRPKWYPQIFLSNIIKGGYSFKEKSVLDFGCGIGTNCCLFEPDFYLGVDCDAKRINYARRNYSGYKFLVSSESTIPVSDHALDYILVISVLHHIAAKKISGYLAEFRRVLKPDGRVLVFEPCFFENSRISNLYMEYFDRGFYIRNKNRYFQIFEDNDFKIDACTRHRQLLYNKLFFCAVPRSF
ncbi:MAG: class I SAM-dependent methyltransferase [Clostridia bacterium]|nr:class I SAM-dependent methyltransferase [Clostridia bacterium]